MRSALFYMKPYAKLNRHDYKGTRQDIRRIPGFISKISLKKKVLFEWSTHGRGLTNLCVQNLCSDTSFLGTKHVYTGSGYSSTIWIVRTNIYLYIVYTNLFLSSYMFLEYCRFYGKQKLSMLSINVGYSIGILLQKGQSTHYKQGDTEI